MKSGIEAGMSYSITAPAIFFKDKSLLVVLALSWLNQFARKLQGSDSLHPPGSGVPGTQHHAHLLLWVLQNPAQVFMFA